MAKRWINRSSCNCSLWYLPFHCKVLSSFPHYHGWLRLQSVSWINELIHCGIDRQHKKDLLDQSSPFSQDKTLPPRRLLLMFRCIEFTPSCKSAGETGLWMENGLTNQCFLNFQSYYPNITIVNKCDNNILFLQCVFPLNNTMIFSRC